MTAIQLLTCQGQLYWKVNRQTSEGFPTRWEAILPTWKKNKYFVYPNGVEIYSNEGMVRIVSYTQSPTNGKAICQLVEIGFPLEVAIEMIMPGDRNVYILYRQPSPYPWLVQ